MARSSKGFTIKSVKEVEYPPMVQNKLPKKSVRERLKKIANEITVLVKEMEG